MTRSSFQVVSLVMAMAVLAAACGDDSNGDGGSANQIDPSDRVWVLTELRGDPPADGTSIDLTLTDERVTGSSGCNTYTGAAVQADGSLKLGPDLATTRMACEEPAMSQETFYLEQLQLVTSYEATETELTLFDGEGEIVARFA